MSNYDEFRFSFKDSSAEEKLAILRSESFRTLPVIQGFAELLRRALEKPETAEKPDELKEWILRIINSAQTLRDLMDALTSAHDPSRGLPELRPYANLLDAVRDDAQKLNLPLAEAVDDLVQSQYPLVLRNKPDSHRQICFYLSNSVYIVELMSYVDNRLFQEEYRISFQTIEDVSICINQWLLENHTLNEMQEMYPPSKKDN